MDILDISTGINCSIFSERLSRIEDVENCVNHSRHLRETTDQGQVDVRSKYKAAPGLCLKELAVLRPDCVNIGLYEDCPRLVPETWAGIVSLTRCNKISAAGTF